MLLGVGVPVGVLVDSGLSVCVDVLPSSSVGVSVGVGVPVGVEVLVGMLLGVRVGVSVGVGVLPSSGVGVSV